MRLIDADALPHYTGYALSADEVASAVENAPTIDAVSVVRCKDCKHRDPEDKKCDCGHAIEWQIPRGDDWFCADGERKDDDKSCDTCKYYDDDWCSGACDGCPRNPSYWERKDK